MEPRDGDLEVTPGELRQLSFFKLVKDARRLPKFEETPGAVSCALPAWRRSLAPGGDRLYRVLRPDRRGLAGSAPRS